MNEWEPPRGTLERLADALERMVEIMEQHLPEDEPEEEQE